jgi:regulator of sigma E protease
MTLLSLIFHNLISFIVIVSFIVFIHELGHFLVARLCGVQVDEFSIGFGKKLFGFFDRKKTLWKFCLLPFGGYVKMYGDRNGASMPDLEAIAKMSPAEKQKSFIFKNVYQRMAIVVAGPVANIVLTIFIFTFLFRLNGLNTVAPLIDEVMPQSAAFESGLKKGDKILEINGEEIKDFNEIRAVVSENLETDLTFVIERAGKVFEMKITPKIQVRKDLFGDDVKMPTIGITASEIHHQDLNLAQSFIQANVETYRISIAIFKAIGELIIGKRSIQELGGPVKIAKYSGKTVDMGIVTVAWFIAMISLNLGVMNLLPIPVLDGGHLFFYIIEAINRKPLSAKTQKFAFQFGLSLVLALMIFTTVNDIRNLIN